MRAAAIYAPTYTLVNAVRKHSASWRSSHRIADAIEVHDTGGILVIGPAIGPSAAWLVVDHLRERGIERLGLVSIAGSLTDLVPGEILLPNDPILENSLLGALKRALTESGAKYHSARIDSSDIPLFERPKETSADAVDMELEMLLRECDRYGIKLACGFVVSDIVGGRRAYRSKEVISSLEALAGAMLTALIHE